MIVIIIWLIVFVAALVDAFELPISRHLNPHKTFYRGPHPPPHPAAAAAAAVAVGVSAW